MSARIEFTDDIGAATLTNGKGTGPDRFRGWSPDVNDIASSEVPVGDGVTQQFLFRRDYIAALELPFIGAASVTTALRLKAHLNGGGEVTVFLNDQSGHEYDCVVAPGTVATFRLEDPTNFEYVFACVLKHLSASPMVADY